MTRPRALIVLAAVQVVLSSPAAASVAPPAPSLVGFPGDGSSDVPTDVVLIYNLFRAAALDLNAPLTGAYELTSQAGAVIPLTVRQSDVSHVELVPAASLAPLTKYTLRSSWMARRYGNPEQIDLGLTFTTGAGPVRGAPPVPSGFLQHYTLDSQATTAGPTHGTCIVHPTEFFVEHLYVGVLNDPSIYDVEHAFRYVSLHGQSTWGDLSGFNPATSPNCLRLRTRAPNGTYSDPVVLCGKDAPHFRVPDAVELLCGREGITYQGRLVTAMSQADAAAPHDPGNSADGSITSPASDEKSLTPVVQGQPACSFATNRPIATSGVWFGLLVAWALGRARRTGRRSPLGSR